MKNKTNLWPSLAQDLAEEAGETLIARLNPYSDGPQRTSTCLTLHLSRDRCSCQFQQGLYTFDHITFRSCAKQRRYLQYIDLHGSTCSSFAGKIVCLQPSDELGLYIDCWLWAVGHDMPWQEALAKTTFYASQLFTPFPDLPIQVQQHKRLSDCQSKNSSEFWRLDKLRWVLQGLPTLSQPLGPTASQLPIFWCLEKTAMTDVVPLPPPKRPESRQVAVEIAMPRRPDSSRRGKRRSPSRQQKDSGDTNNGRGWNVPGLYVLNPCHGCHGLSKLLLSFLPNGDSIEKPLDASRHPKQSLNFPTWKDLVNPVHGSNDPAPVAGSVVSGPGQFRNYASDTRYVEGDPLRHGLDVKQVQATPFAMGPKSTPSSQTSSFRTLDISKANEGRQNWTRYSAVLGYFGVASFLHIFLFFFFIFFQIFSWLGPGSWGRALLKPWE